LLGRGCHWHLKGQWKIIDKDIDATHLIHGFMDQHWHLIGVNKVGYYSGDAFHRSKVSLNTTVARVSSNHRGAVLGERACGGFADTAPGIQDQRI
jgi:hypothetical protein